MRDHAIHFQKMKYFPFLLLSLLWTLSSCQPATNEPGSPAIKAIPVRVQSVEPLTTSPSILAVGQVVSGEDVFLGFRTGGVIRSIFVQEGQQVREGQVLAELDLIDVSAQVQQASLSLEKAERDLARVSSLYADTVATLEQVQDLTTAYQVAKSQLQMAESQQRHARIVAPASGRVLQKMAQSGEVASPGMPILKLGTNGDTRVLRVGLADVDVVNVQLGDEAEVSFDAWPGIAFPAKISELAPDVNPMTGTYEVKMTFVEMPRALKNGFVGKAEIFQNPDRPLAVIPMKGIAQAQGNRVWVYVPTDSGTVTLLELGPMSLGDDYVAVPWEQLAGKEIVTDGAAYLRDGVAVRIIRQNQPEGEGVLIGQR